VAEAEETGDDLDDDEVVVVVVVVVVDFGEDDIATCAEVRRRFEIAFFILFILIKKFNKIINRSTWYRIMLEERKLYVNWKH